MTITALAPTTASAPSRGARSLSAEDFDFNDVYEPSDNLDEVPDLKKALQNFQAASAKPYYDEPRDQKSIAAYYANIEPGDDKKAFFRQLSKLVKESHHTSLPYEPSLYLYPWVDLRPDLSLQSVYSSKPMNAVQAITNDYNKAKYWNQVSQMAATAAFSPERAASQIALTTNQYLNCEHVVCQSWFGHLQPMKGDLHHLFSCDPQCNSARGNRALQELDPAASNQAACSIEGGCGIVASGDNSGFEPEAGKGVAARATLYFLLRYPKKIADYDREDLEMLLKWHREDPPGLYEKHRNQAIEELQGNRNPLIDHPEWADKIDFSLGIRLS